LYQQHGDGSGAEKNKPYKTLGYEKDSFTQQRTGSGN
jgi:hypothetical protein